MSMSAADKEHEENSCEFEEGDIYAEGFGLVASMVMRDESISSIAKALYAYLMTFSNRSGAAWPSTNRTLEEMNLSRNSFYKYRAELRAAGFIDWTAFGREGGGRRTVYRICKVRKAKKGFSTKPRSEQYPKICAIAPEKRRTSSGKPTNSANFGTTNSANFGLSTLNNTNRTKKNSTTSAANDSRAEPRGAAFAGPAVSGAGAPGSEGEEGKNGGNPLGPDPVDASFAALEARSLRRTQAASSLAAAQASYRRLVQAGHSPEEISGAYDNYVRWTEANEVRHVMGLASWLERDDGFELNLAALEAKRAAAEKGAAAREGARAEADYRKRSAAVQRALPDSDAESAYVLAYAESSSDQHLRDVAALLRREKPVVLSNGWTDDRLCRRPSYDALWRLVHSSAHIRTYTETTYSALAAEGKARG